MKRITKAVAIISVAVALILCVTACGEEEAAPPVFSYEYGEKETVTPFWFNENNGYTVVYNEVVVPILYGKEETATGYLAYDPAAIISVRDYTLEKEYGEGDYTVDGNAITVKTDGSMPYIREEWLDNKNIPEEFSDFVVEGGANYNDFLGGTNFGKHVISEGSLTRTNHLCVTYAYKTDENPLGFQTPEYAPEKFARFLGKLEKGEPVKILVFGDSIFTGVSASSVVGFKPGLPAFFDLIKTELATRYYGGDESKITVVNPSVGGTVSSWGVEQTVSGAYDKSGYDLVMIGFGMNDGTLKVSPSEFTANIKAIVEGIREQSPDADYLVVGSFTPNPKSEFFGIHADYIQPTAVLSEELNGETSGCAYLSMYEMTTALLENKQKNNEKDGRYQYIDISSNYTNHPNDFTVRLYAGAILSTFLEFGSAARVA